MAARNEVHNLPFLIRSLKNQNYPAHLFEIIIANDHSTDGTAGLLEKFSEESENLHIIHLAEGKTGKKTALFEAIQKAKGKLILCTDADCIAPPQWIAGMVSCYENFAPKLIIGPVLYKNTPKSIFAELQALENISIAASTAGAVTIGHPIMCGGANIAFEKLVYMQVQEKIRSDIPSGDDMFLLTAIKKYWPNSIRYVKSAEAAVYTTALASVSSFFQQRKRWLSKARYYRDFDIIASAVLVGAANFSIIFTFLLSVFFIQFWYLFIVLFITKSIVDFMLIYCFAHYFRQKKVLRLFPLAQILYPVYAAFILLLGLGNHYEWKGRKLKV